ncbi:MAG: tetratricopeptide repeat protein [Spirochaetales bacterium]|nr:tetratricopeptide repeat protein [Spirochaetales bacterium]
MRLLFVLLLSIALFSCSTAIEDTGPVIEDTGPFVETAPVEEPEQDIPVVIEQIPEEKDVYTTISAAMVVGDIDEAISAYEKAYANDPANTETRILLVNLLMAAGRIDEAKAEIESILSEEPENVNGLYNLSLIQGIQNPSGKSEKQEQTLLRIIELDPGNSRALASLGEIKLRNKELKNARDSFEKSLEAEPENTVALMGYGNVLLREEDPEAAEEQFSKVLDENPEYIFAYVDRSRAKMEKGDYSGAEKDLTSAIELDPNHYWHYIDRGRVRLLGLSDSTGALEDFNRAIEIDPDYFYAHIYRGGILDQKGERKQAIEDYLLVLEARHDYYYIYAPLGVLLYMEERWADARSYFQQAYDFEKEEHFYAFLTALAYRKDGLDDEMEEYLKKAIVLFPRDSLYYKMARIFFESNSEGFVTGEVSREQNNDMKQKNLFILATHSLLNGQTTLAQTWFLEVEDKAFPSSFERRLAIWELEKYRNEGSKQ